MKEDQMGNRAVNENHRVVNGYEHWTLSRPV